MEALSLNPGEAFCLTPIEIEELQHRCVLCTKREKCALDLSATTADPDWNCWQTYCMNATALTAPAKLHG
jgi:hypothetical protein